MLASLLLKHCDILVSQTGDSSTESLISTSPSWWSGRAKSLCYTYVNLSFVCWLSEGLFHGYYICINSLCQCIWFFFSVQFKQKRTISLVLDIFLWYWLSLPRLLLCMRQDWKNGQSKQLWMCLGHFLVGVCRYPQIVSSALNLHITSRAVVLSTLNFMSMSSTYNIVWQALWHDVGGEEQQHWSKHWLVYNYMLVAIV